MKQEEQMYIPRGLFINCKKGNISDEYSFVKESGRGAYGRVYLATTKDQSKIKRAVKVIPKAYIKNPFTFKNEIDILSKLDHPNIIKIYETFEDQNNYYVVTDFCEGGELFDRLTEEGHFSEEGTRQIFKQVLYAINYCHKQKVAHRDLKPENFLLMERNSLSLKVIDFGLSFEWKENMAAELKIKGETKLVGTSYYIAPEIIEGSYDQRCDIWSLGVILYILVTAIPPFDGADDSAIIKAVKKKQYTFNIPEMKHVSPELKNLISRMLMPKNDRIAIEEIYNHPWMTTQLKKTPVRLNYNKIIQFSKYSKLKKFAVTAIASQLCGKDIQKLGSLFQQIDTNHDGFISCKQLRQTLEKQKQHINSADLERMVHYIDTDHNSQINYIEFIACCLENSFIFKEQTLKRVFKTLDDDKDGFISEQELMQVFQGHGVEIKKEIVDEIIKSCDKDGDGRINFKEFLEGMSQV